MGGEHGISREDSDKFSVRSHTLANKAWDEGWLDKEVFPVGSLVRDEGIRPETNEDTLSGLRAVFSKEGQVTAGNASQVSDGASAVLIASEEAAEELGLTVLARIEEYATSEVISSAKVKKSGWTALII